MNKRNLVLLSVLVLLILFGIYFSMGARLKIHTIVTPAAASELPDVFLSVKNIIRSGSAPLTFSSVPDSADGLMLTDISINLENTGMFDAEWISVSMDPAQNDIAVYSMTGEGLTVPAHGNNTLNLKLISHYAENTTRRLTIEYYVYGMEIHKDIQI